MSLHLKMLRLQRGLTQSEVAMRLGLSNHSAVSKLETGKLRLDERRLRALAALYGVSVEEILGMTPAPPPAAPLPPSGERVSVPVPSQPSLDTGAALALPMPIRQEMVRDLPVRGIAACSSGDGAFQIETATVDYVRRPPALVGINEAYGLYMTGDSMEPKFRSGDLVLVHPGRPVRPGDHVILLLRDHPRAEPYAYCKQMLRRHGGKVTVGQYNPAMELEFPETSVVTIHRVLEMSDLFGV